MIQFVQLDAPKPEIRRTTSRITAAHKLDHFLARIGFRREGHRVNPGLYALGNPSQAAPVLVTSNYTLSFDAVRSASGGMDLYILVLDTRGVNVWCAAGKGTFGTEEVVRRVWETGLKSIVTHRTLVLPQLGATGVAAHEVKKRTGFRVEYGPVRAADLPAYLESRQATREMRQVRFGLWDRLVLVPVEVKNRFGPMILAALACYLLGGWIAALAAVTTVLTACVLFPALLPWLPTRDFSTKGYSLGLVAALPFAAASVFLPADSAWWQAGARALSFLLAIPSATAYLALNFTGASTFTSPSGVRREIFAYIPAIAWTFACGVLLAGGLAAARWIGVV